MSERTQELPAEIPQFAVAVNRAIDRRGLTLDRVSAHLRARGHSISIATLSYWQTGRSVPLRGPSIRAVGALEEILRVPRGSLARLVVQPAPPAPPPSIRVADLFTQRLLVDEMLGQLGLTWDHGIELVAVHSVSQVNEDLMLTETFCREVIRTVADDIVAYAVGAAYPAAGCLPEITALHGCSLGRHLGEVDQSARLQELLLPPAPRGHLHVIEYRIAYHPPRPADAVPMTCLLGSTAPVKEMYVEVRFAPEALPLQLCQIEASATVDAAIPCPPKPVLSMRRSHFGPGKVGYEWPCLPATDGAATTP